jgi:hypothetical protein
MCGILAILQAADVQAARARAVTLAPRCVTFSSEVKLFAIAPLVLVWPTFA